MTTQAQAPTEEMREDPIVKVMADGGYTLVRTFTAEDFERAREKFGQLIVDWSLPDDGHDPKFTKERLATWWLQLAILIEDRVNRDHAAALAAQDALAVERCAKWHDEQYVSWQQTAEDLLRKQQVYEGNQHHAVATTHRRSARVLRAQGEK